MCEQSTQASVVGGMGFDSGDSAGPAWRGGRGRRRQGRRKPACTLGARRLRGEARCNKGEAGLEGSGTGGSSERGTQQREGDAALAQEDYHGGSAGGSGQRGSGQRAVAVPACWLGRRGLLLGESEMSAVLEARAPGEGKQQQQEQEQHTAAVQQQAASSKQCSTGGRTGAPGPGLEPGQCPLVPGRAAGRGPSGAGRPA